MVFLTMSCPQQRLRTMRVTTVTMTNEPAMIKKVTTAEISSVVVRLPSVLLMVESVDSEVSISHSAAAPRDEYEQLADARKVMIQQKSNNII